MSFTTDLVQLQLPSSFFTEDKENIPLIGLSLYSVCLHVLLQRLCLNICRLRVTTTATKASGVSTSVPGVFCIVC